MRLALFGVIGKRFAFLNDKTERIPKRFQRSQFRVPERSARRSGPSRLGGFETRMRSGDGAFQNHVEACFLDIVPERRLVFTTVLSEGWRPIEPWLALTAIITIASEGQGSRYSARVLHKTAEDSRKHDEMGFQDGWGTALDQLGALVAQPE